MAKSNMTDGAADTLAAAILVTVAVTWMVLWLASLPA